MFSSFSKVFTVALFAVATFVSASPIASRAEFIVYNPEITSPKEGDAWVGGTKQTVTWNTEGMPEEIQDSNGLLLLGYNEDNSENLDIGHPLASRFPMKAGSVTFTVPQVENRTDYRVVLFGDSGNESPAFTITNTPLTNAGGLLGSLLN